MSVLFCSSVSSHFTNTSYFLRTTSRSGKMAPPVVVAALSSGAEADISVTSDRTLLVGGSVFTVDAVVAGAADAPMPAALLSLVRMRAAAWATTDIVLVGPAARPVLAQLVLRLQRSPVKSATSGDDPSVAALPGSADVADDVAAIASAQPPTTSAAAESAELMALNRFTFATADAVTVVSVAAYFGSKLLRFSTAPTAAAAAGAILGATHCVAVACPGGGDAGADAGSVSAANTGLFRGLLTARDIGPEPSLLPTKPPAKLDGSAGGDESDESAVDVGALEDVVAAVGRSTKERQHLAATLNALYAARDDYRETQDELELLEKEHETLELHCESLEKLFADEKTARVADAQAHREQLAKGDGALNERMAELEAAAAQAARLERERDVAVAHGLETAALHRQETSSAHAAGEDAVQRAVADCETARAEVGQLKAQLAACEQQLQSANAKARAAEMAGLAEFQRRELDWQRVLREADDQKATLMRENEHVRKIAEKQMRTFKLVVAGIEQERSRDQADVQAIVDRVKSLSPPRSHHSAVVAAAGASPPRPTEVSAISHASVPRVGAPPGSRSASAATPEPGNRAARATINLLSPAAYDAARAPSPDTVMFGTPPPPATVVGQGPTRNLDF